MWGTRADFLTLVVIWELNQQNKELSITLPLTSLKKIYWRMTLAQWVEAPACSTSIQ